MFNQLFQSRVCLQGRFSPDKGIALSKRLFSFASLSLIAAVGHANPTVQGNTISWTNDGWYQVQSVSDLSTACQGGISCSVTPGTYHVINHSTGQRWDNLVVGASAPTGSELSVQGGVISWQIGGWVQVQNSSNFETVCEGTTSCAVPDGDYIVVNHTTGQRWDNLAIVDGVSSNGEPGLPPVVVPPVTGDVSVLGNTITWPDNGWYQVQSSTSFETICNGTSNCVVGNGSYIVINHSTGERWNNVEVNASTPTSPNPEIAPTVVGNEIILSAGGWYQIQSEADYSTVCEGAIDRCEVDDGTYAVINHSTGDRWDRILVEIPVIPTTEPETPQPPISPEAPIYTVNPSDQFNADLENELALAPVNGSPSIPANLRVELIGNDWVEINWAPSADDGDVVAYNIYRDGGSEPLYVITNNFSHPNGGVASEYQKYWRTTSFMDCNRTRFVDRVFFCNGGPNGEPGRGPEVGSTHTYQVSAVDNSGNESGLSNPLTVKLYEETGDDLPYYNDWHISDQNGFPFNTDLSSPANYVDDLQMVFDENFDAAEIDINNWNSRLTWGPDVTINDEKQYFVDSINEPDFGYNPFSFTGSTLAIRAIGTPENLLDEANGKRYLSGALSSYDKFGFTYGYVESRIKVSGVFGALSTFYLFHRYPGEQAPEIDIVEYLGYNQYGDEKMFQTYHYHDVNYTDNQQVRSSPTMSHSLDSGDLYADAFHTYGMLWQPGLVIWYIDGVEIKRLSGPQISRQQMNLVTYLVTGSAWTRAPDEYTPADELVEQQTDQIVNLPFKLEADNPIEMEIDYIRVWQRPEHIQ